MFLSLICLFSISIDEGFATRQGFKTLRKDDLCTLDLTRAGRRILEEFVRTESKQESNHASNTPTLQATPTNVHTSQATPTNTQATPTTNCLNPNTHLRYVYKHTFGACTKWHNIGVQLGLPKGILDIIARDPRLHDDSEYYREMLVKWMDSGCAKMEELLVVLEGVTVGMKNVGDAVRALSDDEKCFIGL